MGSFLKGHMEVRYSLLYYVLLAILIIVKKFLNIVILVFAKCYNE